MSSNKRFDEIASGYDKIFSEHLPNAYAPLDHHLKKFVSHNGINNKKILDIGSGTGITSRILKNIGIDGSRIVGIDNSLEMCKTSMEIKNFLEIGLNPVFSDAYHIPCNPKSMNLIVCPYALHEIIKGDKNDLNKFLVSMVNHSNEKGIIIISDAYYPKNESEEDVNKSINWIKNIFGHATPRDELVMPEELVSALEDLDVASDFMGVRANEKYVLGCYSIYGELKG